MPNMRKDKNSFYRHMVDISKTILSIGEYFLGAEYAFPFILLSSLLPFFSPFLSQDLFFFHLPCNYT